MCIDCGLGCLCRIHFVCANLPSLPPLRALAPRLRARAHTLAHTHTHSPRSAEYVGDIWWTSPSGAGSAGLPARLRPFPPHMLRVREYTVEACGGATAPLDLFKIPEAICFPKRFSVWARMRAAAADTLAHGTLYTPSTRSCAAHCDQPCTFRAQSAAESALDPCHGAGMREATLDLCKHFLKDGRPATAGQLVSDFSVLVMLQSATLDADQVITMHVILRQHIFYCCIVSWSYFIIS